MASSTSAQKLVSVNYPGATHTAILGINNKGVAVGRYTLADGTAHGFTLSEGKFTNIDVPFGTSTSPSGINDNGDVVGTYSGGGFKLVAGTYRSITFPGALFTIPTGINNAGQIVGYYLAPPQQLQGFLASGAQFSTIACPCGTSTLLGGINNSGTIVGLYNGADNLAHGLKYSSGSFVTIDYPGELNTIITGINDAGTLVGAFKDAITGLQTGFSDSNGKFSTIGVPPAPDTAVDNVAINNSGQIVGSSSVPNSGNSLENAFFVSTGPYAYVPVSSANSVSVFDTSFDLPTSTISVGARPIGVAVSPQGGAVYVANYNGNTVSAIDAATHAVTATIPVGSSPLGIAFTPNGSFAYIANNLSASVSVINTALKSVVATVPVGSVPTLVAATPDGKFVYVTNQSSANVSVISTTNNNVIATVPVGAGPVGVASTPDSKFVYVTLAGANSIVAINTSTNTVGTPIPVGAAPVRITITHDGITAYVSNQNSGNIVSVVNLATQSVAGNILVGSIPYGTALTPDGAFVWAVNNGSSSLSLIATATNSVVSTIPVGGVATDVAIGPTAPTSQSITQPLSPIAPNQFNFGAHTFTVQYPPGTAFTGVNMTVVAAQANQQTFKQRVAGTTFANATCIVYAGAGGNCVDYQVTCTNSGGSAISCPATSTPSITVKSSFDTQQQIINPGFLTTPIGTNAWTNIFSAFYLQRIDPTMVGHTRGFSEFVAVDLGPGNSQGVGTFSILAPLQLSDARIFPVGTVIPVEFQLASQAHPGTSVTDATAGMTVVMVSDANGNATSKIVLQQPAAFTVTGSGYVYSLNTAGYAPGVYDVTIYGDAFVAQQIQFTLPIATTGVHLLTTVKSLTLNSSTRQYVAVFNVSNSGTTSANGVVVTASKLNTASTSTALPLGLGDIGAGSSATVTLTYPASAGTPGSVGAITISESYAGGNGGGGSRVTLP